MIDLTPLISQTGAFRRVKSEKETGSLSHAYLLVCPDETYLDEYLNAFARLIMCDGDEDGRKGRLIREKCYADVNFYPKKTATVTAEEVSDLIEKSCLKPVEDDKKLFVLSNAETMNVSAQNKLLKTLEEPPANTYILIGTRNEFPILQTVKSRVNKLEIPPFSPEKLFGYLADGCEDKERLKEAVSACDGTVGNALKLYGDDKFGELSDFVADMITNMQSSADILDYSFRLEKLGVDTEEFLSVLESYFRDMLLYFSGRSDLAFNKTALERVKNARGYNKSALVYALEEISETRKRKKSNVTGSMLTERLLFSILEGKHKWQKS